MSIEKQIIEEFRLLGQPIHNKPEILGQCIDLCTIYSLSAADLSAKWEAYMTNNNIDTISLNHISTIKRQIAAEKQQEQQLMQQKLARKRPAPTPLPPGVGFPSPVSSLSTSPSASAASSSSSSGFHSSPPAATAPSSHVEFDTESTPYNKRTLQALDDSLFNLYGVKEDSPLRAVQLPSNKRSFGSPPPNRVRSTDDITLSPTSFSPINLQSSVSYAERSNIGKVELTFNSALQEWSRPLTSPPRMIDLTVIDNAQLTPYRYMFQKLADRAGSIDARIEELSDRIKRKFKLDEYHQPNIPMQSPFVTAGMICCDAEGRLNEQSIILQGSRDLSSGARVPVDLTDVEQFSLFPGQVIAMEGFNNNGDRFSATRLYQGAPLPMFRTVPHQLLDYYSDFRNAKQPMTMYVASGPFCSVQDVSYAPLMDLATLVDKEKPDVLFLLGPFVDRNHPAIVAGELDITFEQLFSDAFADTVRKLLFSCPGLHIIMVPSVRDAIHDNVFPQPPLATTLFGFDHERLFLYPNPATITINEITVGITTNDILLHLGSEETSKVKPGESYERLARLAAHLIEQRSYYPLFPPAAGANLEMSKRKQIGLPFTPDILLVPSDLKFFAKPSQQCLCINPGRLIKEKTGGTFAKITVFPPRENLVPKGDTPVLHNLAPRTRVEIVRI